MVGPTFTLVFTLDQINEMIACMNDGPYGRVNRIIQELSRQMTAQMKPSPEPPPAKPSNGSDEHVELVPS